MPKTFKNSFVKLLTKKNNEILYISNKLSIFED